MIQNADGNMWFVTDEASSLCAVSPIKSKSDASDVISVIVQWEKQVQAPGYM